MTSRGVVTTAGQDAGSTVNPMPSVSEIVAMGKAVLAAP